MSKRGAEELLVSPVAEDFKKIDTKSTPIKEASDTIECESYDTVVSKIKETAPEWFMNAFTFIINTIKKESSSTTVVQKQLENKIKVLEKRIIDLECVKSEQDSVISKLKDNVDNLEAYSRRDNLVIEGISESPNENVRGKVLEFLKTKLDIKDAADICLSRAHRIGIPPHQKPSKSTHPRPIIIRFQNFLDRENVWKASWKMKDKNLFVREDFTEAMRQRRNKLLPVLKVAKQDKSVQKCSLRGDKLIIDGTKYTAQEFEKIPEHLKWTVKGERYFSQCNSTFFFGKDCFMSNHHMSPFQDNGTQYLCAEQFYLRQKSLFFDDVEAANKIMKTTDPGQVKRLSHYIKGLDEHKWNSMAKTVMKKRVNSSLHRTRS